MAADFAGQTLGQYQIKEQVGQGGMATVYKAYQPSLDRFVAVKILPPFQSQQVEANGRFQREARAIATLNHPNILPVYDFGQTEQCTYLVMRYIEGGRTLRTLMAEPLSLPQMANLVEQIAAALGYAHSQGIIHRDVKPGNVLMDKVAYGAPHPSIHYATLRQAQDAAQEAPQDTAPQRGGSWLRGPGLGSRPRFAASFALCLGNTRLPLPGRQLAIDGGRG